MGSFTYKTLKKDTLPEIRIVCIRGDITSQDDITAIVNAANARLVTGGGVAGAIHRVAGPGLEQECKPLAPINPGEAVITGAHRLPNRFVIHCLGPVYGRDKPEDELLANCYRNALRLADEHKIESIAFPSISTGAFGYPLEKAADVAAGAIMGVIPELQHLKLIRMVLFSNGDLEIYSDRLRKAGFKDRK
jgi:O-acetyl-ADP-ribose deacetylase